MTAADVLHQFTAEDERRHPAGADPWWQESIAIHWFDAAGGAGGMHRIGHEPGQEGGQIAHHHGVFDQRQRWRHNVRSPMAGQLSDAWFGDGEGYRAQVGAALAAAERTAPAAGVPEVLAPGIPEARSREARGREGIAVPEATWQDLARVGERFSVPLPDHREV